MRRSTVIGIFMPILIAGSILFAMPTSSAYATVIELPPKSTYIEAVARIESFASYPKYYGTNSTPITPSDQYYQEYEYLHSLAEKTKILIARYDDPDFTARNIEAYNVALTAIDQAITGCRYIFGIVRAESLAAEQAAQSTPVTPTTSSNQSVPVVATNTVPPTSTTPTTVAPVITPTTTVADTTPTSTASATTASTSDSSKTSPIALSTTETTDDIPEVPHTGEVNSSSPLIFILIISLSATLASILIYFVYNHKTKYNTLPAHKKRY